MAKTKSEPDTVLSAACVAGLLLVSWLIAQDGGARNVGAHSSATAIGALTHAQATIRRRPMHSLGWDTLVIGDETFTHDTIFVPPGTDAVITLRDGTELTLEENSLLVLEESNQEAPHRLSLTKGALTSRSKEKGVVLDVGGRAAELTPGTEARLDSQERIDVLAGEVKLAGAAVKEGQSSKLSEPGQIVLHRAMLASPPPGARVYAAAGVDGSIALRFRRAAAEREPLFVQVAATSDFLRPAIAREAGAAEVEIAWGRRGPVYWRLVDGAGSPASPTSYFVVADNEPPRALVPRDLEYLVAKRQADALLFSWTEVDGATTYVLEIAADAGFRDVVLQQKTKNATEAVPNLAEGLYHWRVHAERSSGPPSPASPPRSFRLTRKPLPHAPELYDPELELRAHDR
ncbi:MAG: FecR domain-containing protein [Deltaproteobacteria bacterium]|nr:FecR domain-containing protein [Deltaproteobacteria bacterium]